MRPRPAHQSDAHQYPDEHGHAAAFTEPHVNRNRDRNTHGDADGDQHGAGDFNVDADRRAVADLDTERNSKREFHRNPDSHGVTNLDAFTAPHINRDGNIDRDDHAPRNGDADSDA